MHTSIICYCDYWFWSSDKSFSRFFFFCFVCGTAQEKEHPEVFLIKNGWMETINVWHRPCQKAHGLGSLSDHLSRSYTVKHDSYGHCTAVLHRSTAGLKERSNLKRGKRKTRKQKRIWSQTNTRMALRCTKVKESKWIIRTEE